MYIKRGKYYKKKRKGESGFAIKKTERFYFFSSVELHIMLVYVLFFGPL